MMMAAARERRLQHTGNLAQEFRRVHFVGIGGSGMSGIAEVLCTLGYEVSGSDNADNAATRRLVSLGARVMRGHNASNVLGTDCVVVSSAIKHDNPELMEARSQRIPIVPRAAMLAELMRFRRGIAVAGTHGKTTTTSLTAAVLSEGGLDPTFVIGGQLLAAGANAKLGDGQWLVAEADESDGSFLRLNPLMAVITNIDSDHLENYDNDFSKVQAAFAEFLQRLPFYGLAVLCIDDPEVAALAADTPRHVMSYGFAENADVRAEEVTQEAGCMRFTLRLPEDTQVQVTLALPGRHNVQNALGAIAMARELGISFSDSARALGAFQGAERRFQRHGEARGVVVVEDYGHHPTEIAAVIAAAKPIASGRLIIAFQPHRFTRTQSLMAEFGPAFAGADLVMLTDIYGAGEDRIDGVTIDVLAVAMKESFAGELRTVPVLRDVPRELARVSKSGDLIVLLGAGSIGAIPAAVLKALEC